jgi:DNA-binding Lrp family transcriptional regulator
MIFEKVMRAVQVLSEFLCRSHSLSPSIGDRLSNVATLDDIDITLLRLMRSRPKTPVAELARLAHVARGTAQARIARMEQTGVIVGYGPDLDAAAIEHGVLAFSTLQIAQGQGDAVVAILTAIPQVLEVYAVTGTGDLSAESSPDPTSTCTRYCRRCSRRRASCVRRPTSRCTPGCGAARSTSSSPADVT